MQALCSLVYDELYANLYYIKRFIPWFLFREKCIPLGCCSNIICSLCCSYLASLSLNDEGSGGFLTANFYQSYDNVASESNDEMAETITKQNSEIAKLVSENSTYKQKYSMLKAKCEKLSDCMHRLQSMYLRDLNGLRESSNLARQDLNVYAKDMEKFQREMLDSLQGSSVELLEKQKQQDSKHAELEASCQMLREDNKALLAQLRELADAKDHETVKAVSEAELQLSKRLCLEHELELDQIRSNMTLDLDLLSKKLADRDTERENLQMQINTLNQQKATELAKAEQHIEALNTEFIQKLDSSIAELKLVHKQEIEQLRCQEKINMQKALDDQKLELTTSYNQQIQVVSLFCLLIC